MTHLVHKTENGGPDLTDSLHIPCKDKYKIEDIKLNKENTDKENAETSQEIIDVKETEIRERSSELSLIVKNNSELKETKDNVLDLPVIKEKSLELALITENGSEPSIVMDEFVGIENDASESIVVRESALDVAPMKENTPELTSTIENILQLTMVDENASNVLAIKEGDVNDSLLSKVDLGPEIDNIQQHSKSKDAFNHCMSQSIQLQGPSELNQDKCENHSEKSKTQSDCSTLRKLLTTNDWSTLRHRYDISEFGSQYGKFLCKNSRTDDIILNEDSNTTKKSTEIKYVVKKKKNKNEKVLTAYKEKYVAEAKKSQINVERKKTIAFFNHYNFHTNKQIRAERNKLETNISDINCNFNKYEENSVKNKLCTDVSDTIYNLQTITENVGENDESPAYISDIYNLHINNQNSIETNKLDTSLLDPFYILEANKKNGFDKSKISTEVSDVNYNFHTNKLNCKAKTKIHTAISTDTVFNDAQNTVEKASFNTVSDSTNKMIDIESHLPSYKIKDRNIYECISCDYSPKDSALNRSLTTSDFGTYKCKRKSVKGLLSNHTRTHGVHKSYTSEGCCCKGKKKSIHTNGKPCKCTCVHKHKRNREMFSKPRIHVAGGPCSCEFCGYQSAQLGSLKDHMIHTRGKSFSCDLCEYKCGTKLHLVNYVKTLSGENCNLEYGVKSK